MESRTVKHEHETEKMSQLEQVEADELRAIEGGRPSAGSTVDVGDLNLVLFNWGVLG